MTSTPTNTPTNIIDELSWRGLINQSTDLDALRAACENPITLYCGFDPTADSLHAGHLVPLLVLRRFQHFGHNPIAVGGGATGMIGDPRDVGERSMLTADTVAANLEKIKKQISRFITFDGDHAARLVNNADWTNQLSVTDFLRDVGKHFSLNTMLARETVKRRLESDGISYTEFSYMLLQANDYAELHRQYGCTLQIGGGDQWGNIIAGVDYNRRVNNATVHALTVPLVTDSEGNKFGKSTGGGKLWLDPELTSPYAWYQYFINTGDADVIRYLRWFTFLTQEELDALAIEVAERPHARAAQRRLAQEMTTLVHGADATAQVELASLALFGRGELTDLTDTTLRSVLAEAGLSHIDAATHPTVIDLFLAAGLTTSKGDTRRALADGGLYINNQRITDETWTPDAADLLHGRYLVLRRGKKNFGGIELT